MSHRLQRCRHASCRQSLFWALNERGRRIPLNDHGLTVDEARADPAGVFYLHDGRAFPWSPMLALALDEDLYRAHWITCAEPRRAPTDVTPPEPIPVPAPPAPEPQLRLPVLPHRFTRRSLAVVAHTHERGNHDEHHDRVAA